MRRPRPPGPRWTDTRDDPGGTLSRPDAHGVRFSPEPDQDVEIRVVLGHAVSGAADVGEVLAAVEDVRGHRQPLARALTEERVYDWLDGYLAG